MANKKENIEIVAKYLNRAETMYDAIDCVVLNTRLELELAKNTLRCITTGMCFLNNVANDKFHEEWCVMSDYEYEIRDFELDDEASPVSFNSEVDEITRKIREYLVVFSCIVKYGENYHEDYI